MELLSLFPYSKEMPVASSHITY